MTQVEDGTDAFTRAIDSGILTTNEEQENYAGKYMYMYTDDKGDAFKNIRTRRYLWTQDHQGETNERRLQNAQ